MSDSDEHGHVEEENEVDPRAHKKLLQAIGQLSKNQHIRKPTRSEPSLARDEFHLVKPLSTKVQTVSMGDVMKMLKKTSKHLEVGKELKRVQNSKKIMRKPLERPIAERIHRTVGYEKAKKSLSRWDAVVERNRVAEHQVFPLDYEEVHVDIPAPKKPKGTAIKSDLMLEMEAVEAKLRKLKGSKGSNNAERNENRKQMEKLTRDELIARRKELAYLRVRESQKSAKARLQNKIKSKKYHKFLKREKLKEQLKEFELLQKTNPEAALEKLESIEKNRVLERANLRHKNTGTWAKNLQVRAKYDKDVRKDLAEQLALSRELTDKKRNEADSQSEAEEERDNENGLDADNYDPFNPWVKGSGKIEQSDEMNEYLSGYRKYWMERNRNEKELKEFREGKGTVAENGSENDEQTEDVNRQSDDDYSEEEIEKFKTVLTTKLHAKNEANKTENGSSKKTKKKQKLKKRPQIAKDAGNCEWTVEDVDEDMQQDIDDIFDNAEESLQQNVAKKLSELRKSLETNKAQKSKEITSKRKTNSQDLSFKTQAKRPDIDEQLLETPANNDTVQLPEVSKHTAELELNMTTNNNSIDPNRFANIKPKMLKTALPDIVNSGDFSDDDDDRNDNKQMTIAEAFEDDDIVADFEHDKEEERKKAANEDIDLTLPGWGSWAGCGLSPGQPNKTKRLILKFPKDAPRRDENKGNVFINENANSKLKKHLVSDLPFPFESVQEYEASIRAPVGRSFVPETAFRMLTRPATVTKMGAVITPMDDEVLVKTPKRPRSVVDRRIAEFDSNKK